MVTLLSYGQCMEQITSETEKKFLYSDNFLCVKLLKIKLQNNLNMEIPM